MPKHLLNVGNRNTLYNHVPSKGVLEAVASLFADASKDGNLREQSVDLLPTETRTEAADKKEL